MNEQELFNLQKEIIKQHPEVLGNIKPRPIKFVKKSNYLGRADKNFLRLNKNHVEKSSKDEIMHLLSHELNHYAVGGYGHSNQFLENMKKMGYEINDYENHRCDGYNMLQGRYKETVKKDKDGKEYGEVKITKKPSWKIFECDVLYCTEHSGGIFKILRKMKGLSLKEVAKQMNVTQSYLKEFEKTKDVQDARIGDSFKLKYSESFLKKLFYFLARSHTSLKKT